MPEQEPTPPALTGWQWIAWQALKLVGPALVSALISGLGMWYAAGRADDAKADTAGAREEIGTLREDVAKVRRVVYGGKE